jgi:hypothetical protein
MRDETIKRNRGTLFFQEWEYNELPQIPETKVAEVNRERRSTIKGKCKNGTIAATFSGRDPLSGVRSLDDLNKIAREGWQDGMNRAMELKSEIEELVPRPVSVRRKLNWRDEGDELSHDRLYGGQIDSMWRVGRRQSMRSPRTISILANFGGNTHQSGEQLFWSGAAMLALSDLLENAGYSTDLSAGAYVTSGGDVNVLVIRVKEAGDPLRADSVATVAAHSAFFRMYGLMALERAPFQVPMGHGQAQDITRHMDTVKELMTDKIDVVIKSCNNRAEAVAELKRVVARLNEGLTA